MRNLPTKILTSETITSGAMRSFTTDTVASRRGTDLAHVTMEASTDPGGLAGNMQMYARLSPDAPFVPVIDHDTGTVIQLAFATMSPPEAPFLAKGHFNLPVFGEQYFDTTTINTTNTFVLNIYYAD